MEKGKWKKENGQYGTDDCGKRGQTRWDEMNREREGKWEFGSQSL